MHSVLIDVANFREEQKKKWHHERVRLVMEIVDGKRPDPLEIHNLLIHSGMTLEQFAEDVERAEAIAAGEAVRIMRTASDIPGCVSSLTWSEEIRQLNDWNRRHMYADPEPSGPMGTEPTPFQREQWQRAENRRQETIARNELRCAVLTRAWEIVQERGKHAKTGIWSPWIDPDSALSEAQQQITAERSTVGRIVSGVKLFFGVNNE